MGIKSNIEYLIFEYISLCFDEYKILPSEDDVYLRFQKYFDNGIPFEIAEHEMRMFISTHDLTGIGIRWEGDISEYNSG